MREKKFRAWDKEEKRMITDEQHFIPAIVTNKGVFKLNPNLRNDNWILMPVERFDLLEYTGLKDKNFKEIYEGDILGIPNWIVTYVDSSDGANKGLPVGWYEQRDDFESYRQLEVGDELEVIGNIYENPELVK